MLFRFGCFLTAVAVLLQAFGAHVLQHVLEERYFVIYGVASRFLVWGGIWTLVLSVAERFYVLPAWALRLVLFGVLFFSATLLFYVFFHYKFLVMLTPIGGMSMVVGFVWLGVKGQARLER